MGDYQGKIHKKRKNVVKVHQDRSHTYYTGDYTLKKTKGFDELSKNEDERRGRNKKNGNKM